MDNSTSAGAGSILAAGVLIYLIIVLAVAVFAIFCWWRIFSKAGYSGALSILMVIPIANLVVFLMLAFGDWPILRELNALRQNGMRPPFPPQGSYPPPPGGGYPQSGGYPPQ